MADDAEGCSFTSGPCILPRVRGDHGSETIPGFGLSKKIQVQVGIPLSSCAQVILL